MREIKFRAKRKLNGDWVFGSYHFVGGNDWCKIIPYDEEEDAVINSYYRVITDTVGEFTGKRLGNVDLYEGDIIREEQYDETNQDEINYYVVVWIKEWCMFACLHVENEYKQYLAGSIEQLDESMFWTFPLTEEEHHIFEESKKSFKKFLAGNVHDNPELLNYHENKLMDMLGTDDE